MRNGAPTCGLEPAGGAAAAFSQAGREAAKLRELDAFSRPEPRTQLLLSLFLAGAT